MARLIFLLFTALLLAVSSRAASAAEDRASSLREALKIEESKAVSRQSGLKRLTEEEKRLDASLATAEASILALEKGLEESRGRLSGLAADGESAQKDHDRLLMEQQKTENALRELLTTLWSLHIRRAGVGGRDMELWPVIDREYYWTTELLKSIEAYQATLRARELEIAVVTEKRGAIGVEVAGQMALADREKTRLLAERLKYEQRLAEVRRQRKTAETELRDALRLIDELNFDLRGLRDASASLESVKGRLPWPTAGRIARKFNPSAPPPASGLGFATDGKSEVRAIHDGKVMFSDTMRGMGLVVVVRHGEEYYSVYAFLSDRSVSPGQDVSKGQTLGRSGYFPDLRGSGLYFEIRRRQAALNPEPWLEKT